MADESEQIADGSRYRIALELANIIKRGEHLNAVPPSPRAYWLSLYRECLDATK